ncbi:MAG TPA: alpha/beta hydrolase-fold protein [Planctomycetota bacterium]|nr:alpha/beta hydrolase-fold protein [Planctomycetota bacterium]
MSHPLLTVSCLLALLAVAPAQRQGRGARAPASPTLEHFTFEAGTFASEKVRDGEAGYYIYLPKGYADPADKDKKYPWILWLPGFGGPNDFPSRGGAEVLDRLRGDGTLPELALVVFRAPGRRPRTTYMNGEAQCDAEDLITGDLLEHLQSKYRLSSERTQRAVMGVSAGGFGALKIAMRHPELFGAVAVHSAAILPADPADLGGMNETVVQRQLRSGLAKELGDPIDKDKWAAHMPLAIVATKKPSDLRGLQIYFDAGTDDDYGFCEPNEQLDKVMTANGFVHLFRKVDGGGHAWSSPTMKQCVAKSLQFVGLALSGKDAVAAMSPKAAEAAPGAGKADK